MLPFGVCLRVMRSVSLVLPIALLTGCFDFSSPADLPNGALSEGNGSACASGHNADGVCCEAECDAACYSCARPYTGQPSGVCAPVIAGLDPNGSCEDACNGDGACGARSGTACSTDAQCSSASCRDGFCCDQSCDGACVGCSRDLTGNPDGVCGFVSTGQRRENGCVDGVACDGAGECFDRPLSETCTNGFECFSGHCADGMCCSTQCDGVCETCSGGQCLPIPAGADPENECPGEASCSGSGSCDSVTGDTPCADDEDCQGGFCCDGICHSNWEPLPLALNASEEVTAVHILSLHVPVIGTSQGRVLRYSDAGWQSLGTFTGATISRLDGNDAGHFVAFDRVNHEHHRWVLGAWTVLAPPVAGANPDGLFVDGDTSFYVFQGSNVWRWEGGYTLLTQATPGGDVWQAAWTRNGKVYIGGGELVVVQRAGWCGNDGRVVEVSGSQLIDTGWTLKCPTSASDGRYGPVAAINYFPGVRGDGVNPGTPPSAESVLLNDAGNVSVIDNELWSRIAVGGTGQSLFRAQADKVSWNTNGTWRSKTLGGSVAGLAAGARCEAYAITSSQVYRF